MIEAKAARRNAAAAKWLSFERIRSDKHGALVVGLMIAANDLLLANWNAMEWGEDKEEELPRLRWHLRIGAQQYFVRLMVSHLHEALALVEEFKQHPDLIEILKRCSRQAQLGFKSICDCLPGGPDSKLFGLHVSRLRNKLSFHYDKEHIDKALDSLAVDPTRPPAMITMGGDYYLSRFNLADRVCDSVLVRQFLQHIPGGTIGEKLNTFMDFVNQKCLAFLFFAREFAGTYFSS